MPNLTDLITTNPIQPGADVYAAGLDGDGQPAAIALDTVAPINAQYLTAGPDGILTNERVLTAGDGITLTSGTGILTISASGSASYPDAAPASPSAYDDEFTSTSLDAKWTETTSGTVSKTINGATNPSHIQWSVAAGGSVAIRQAFTPGANTAFSVTARFRPLMYTNDYVYWRLYIKETTANLNNIVQTHIIHDGSVKHQMQGNIGGAFSTWSTQVLTPLAQFIHVQRSAANVWSSWFSPDGFTWIRSTGTVTSSFTVGHIGIECGNTYASSGPMFMALDWVRANWITL